MIHEALVADSGPGWARVIIDRCSECGSCKACESTAGGSDKMEARAVDAIGVQAGDKVKVVMESSYAMRAAALVYGVPSAVFLASVLIFRTLMPRLGMGELGSDLGAVGGALALMGIVFWFVHVYDVKRASKERRFQLRIIEKMILIIVIAAFCGLMPGCSRQLETVSVSDAMMGTNVSVTVRSRNRKDAEAAAGEALAAMEKVEQMMSVRLENSEIFRVNRDAGRDWVPVSPRVVEVIRESIKYCNLSQGAFDIAVRPLLLLWGKVKETHVFPTEDEIKAAQALVTCGQVELDESGTRVRFKNPGAGIDLGGIAKGYAIDKAIEALQKMGIEHALVVAGGDIRTLGAKDQGEPWVLGLRNPREHEQYLLLIKVENMAVTTSGDYERYFIEQGKKINHIVDPRTGKSSDLSISATIIAPTATQADALSTAVFVLGPEKGIELIEKLEGVEGLIVSADRKLYPSSGFSKYEVKK